MISPTTWNENSSKRSSAPSCNKSKQPSNKSASACPTTSNPIVYNLSAVLPASPTLKQSFNKSSDSRPRAPWIRAKQWQGEQLYTAHLQLNLSLSTTSSAISTLLTYAPAGTRQGTGSNFLDKMRHNIIKNRYCSKPTAALQTRLFYHLDRQDQYSYMFTTGRLWAIRPSDMCDSILPTGCVSAWMPTRSCRYI